MTIYETLYKQNTCQKNSVHERKLAKDKSLNKVMQKERKKGRQTGKIQYPVMWLNAKIVKDIKTNL